MSVSEPVLNTEGAGEFVEFGNGSRAEIAVGKAQSGGEYAVVRYHVVSGDEPPLHTHSKEDEMVFVVEGKITAFVGDSRVDIGPGICRAAPWSSSHDSRPRRLGDTPAHPRSGRPRAVLCTQVGRGFRSGHVRLGIARSAASVISVDPRRPRPNNNKSLNLRWSAQAIWGCQRFSHQAV